MEDKIKSIAIKYGYQTLRPGQFDVTKFYSEGFDVFFCAPTGAGKSASFELASDLLEGIILIISPLVSLMTMQAAKLNEMGIKAGYIVNSEEICANLGDATHVIKVLPVLYLIIPAASCV